MPRSARVIIEEPVVITETRQTHNDPNISAEDLIRYLPEDVQRNIREAAKTTALPLWQMLLGYVMRIADLQELYTPYVLAASWESGRPANSVRPCESCGQEFFSKFPSARYCCEKCYFGKVAEMGHAKDCVIGMKNAG